MKNLILGTIILVAFFVVGKVFATAPAPYKVICHTNPAQSVTLSFQNVQSYNGHLGTPHNTETFDTDGECLVEVTPTPTDEPTPTPTDEPECEVECEEPEITPTPTEEPCRENCGTPPTFAGSSTEAPICSDRVPGKVANIFVATGTPNDGKLEVRWLSDEPKGNKAHIRYTEGNGENWNHALLNTDNDGIEVIGGLINGTHYNFQVVQVNGCAVGPWSSTYDPLP